MSSERNSLPHTIATLGVARISVNSVPRKHEWGG